ncbi:MAG: tetratricopeptide repeat protein, partial [Chloroflexota bacterium]|nr:tetratricopeptide repeat protein [Chloroflexota bacterium]
MTFFYGDWETAISEYQQTLESSPSPQEKSAALLGLGKTYYQLQNYPEALDNLRTLLSSYSDSSTVAEAQFVLAQTYTALNRHLEAASAYEAYLSYNLGIIDAYIQEQRGDAYTAAGKYLIAIEAYQAAIAADSLQDNVNLRLKMGQAYFALEDYPTSIVLYEEAYAETNNDYLKASADYLLGLAFTALERPIQAQAAYRDAVENYPLSYDAYLSLVELIEAGCHVSELDRGLVDYFVGQYGLASEAFDRYISQVKTGEITEGDPATAYYYKGFALRAQGDAEGALWAWDKVIENYPEHAYWDNAWEYKAYTQWAYLNRYSHAVQTLTGFVDKRPYHERAAEFLFDAARVEELTKDYDAAISLWNHIISEYPTSDYANNALF